MAGVKEPARPVHYPAVHGIGEQFHAQHGDKEYPDERKAFHGQRLAPTVRLHNQAGGRFGAADHAGDARARVSARADEVEVGIVIVAVMPAEPRVSASAGVRG